MRMAFSPLQLNDMDFYDSMSAQSMLVDLDDGAPNFNKHQQFPVPFATLRSDGASTSGVFVLEPFSGQPSSTGYNYDNKDPTSSQIPHDITNEPEANETEEYGLYYDLYKAAVRGDWETANAFLWCHFADTVNPRNSKQLKIALHLAIGTGRSNHFVEKLLDYIQPSDLALQDDKGETTLTVAATVGNLEAAKLLVKKNPELPLIYVCRGGESALPLHQAIQFNQKEMVLYLMEVMNRKGIHPSPYDGESGAMILILLVLVGYHDVALDLLKKHPGMGSQAYVGETPLSMLAVKPFDFPSGCGFRNWKRIVYDYSENPVESTEVQAQTSSYLRSYMSYVWQILLVSCWKVIEILVPQVKHIRKTKVKHDQVLEIVRRLSTYASSLDFSQAEASLRIPLLLAAEFGIPEIIEEIAEQMPHLVWKSDPERHGILQRAVVNRQEKVFNLLYQIGGHKYYMMRSVDLFGNNLLHLAGHLAPPHRLNIVSGAALQMQRELQWYKEVEQFLAPVFRQMKNGEGKKPAEVFTEQHKDLVIEGEKWMKDTANSCTVVAALIATVVFAAAITVPGGNGDSGSPLFFKEKAFVIFAVSDALSLFSSTAAILMFLSILTARYAEDDFLYALPKRLIMGLLTLFVSITSMMIAFSSTLYLVFGEGKKWILTSVAGSSCLLVALFVYLQCPLLIVMINSTYGAGIFGPQRKHPLI